MALRDAGIAPYNLVTVSSIYAPRCKIVSREKGAKKLKHGQIVNCILARQDTNEPVRLIAASIGLAVPRNKNAYGYLSEHHSYGETDEKAAIMQKTLLLQCLQQRLE